MTGCELCDSSTWPFFYCKQFEREQETPLLPPDCVIEKAKINEILKLLTCSINPDSCISECSHHNNYHLSQKQTSPAKEVDGDLSWHQCRNLYRVEVATDKSDDRSG